MGHSLNRNLELLRDGILPDSLQVVEHIEQGSTDSRVNVQEAPLNRIVNIVAGLWMQSEYVIANHSVQVAGQPVRPRVADRLRKGPSVERCYLLRWCGIPPASIALHAGLEDVRHPESTILQLFQDIWITESDARQKLVSVHTAIFVAFYRHRVRYCDWE